MKNKWEGVNKAKKARAKRGGKGAAKLTEPERLWMEELERRRAAGEIQDFAEHPCSLRLGHGLHYEPDFMVVTDCGVIEMHELKGPRGFALDAKGRVKLYTAASLYPVFRFLLVQQRTKKAGGGFKVEEIPARVEVGE